MEIDLITFSPTHMGATVARQAAAGFSTAADHTTDHDLTLPGYEPSIVVKDMAIFVAPVYGGRVAETAVERFTAVHAAASKSFNVCPTVMEISTFMSARVLSER